MRWKEWAGYFAVCSYDVHHDREYFAIRQAAGLLDVTPLFKYRVHGRQAAEFLAWVMARDIRKLKIGRVAYCSWTDDRGYILDDGTVTRLDENEYRVTSADPSLAWLRRNAAGFAVEIEDWTERLGALALQGPTSRKILQEVCDTDLDNLRFFGATQTELWGVPVTLTRTGFTGDLGYEVWCGAEDALIVWDALMRAGRSFGIQAIGLDALDVSRIEACFVLQGCDYFSARHCLTDAQKSTPFELDLGWTVALERDPFVGQAALQAEWERGPERAFVALNIDYEELEALFDTHGLPIELPHAAWRTAVPVYAGRKQVGRATSGAWSPTTKTNMALATVEVAHAIPGTELKIEVTVDYRRYQVGATVVPKPFFNPDRKRV